MQFCEGAQKLWYCKIWCSKGEAWIGNENGNGTTNGAGLLIIHCGKRKCVACSLEIQTHLRRSSDYSVELLLLLPFYIRVVRWENSLWKIVDITLKLYIQFQFNISCLNYFFRILKSNRKYILDCKRTKLNFHTLNYF